MKKLLIIVGCCLLGFGLMGYQVKGGNVKNVKVGSISSDMYSKEDINSAIDTIMDEFKKNWDGCTLKEIYYLGDKASIDHQDWADRNNASETIVLSSTFNVNAFGGDGSLNPNSTYEDWNWILVRNKDGNWVHVDHGY